MKPYSWILLCGKLVNHIIARDQTTPPSTEYENRNFNTKSQVNPKVTPARQWLEILGLQKFLLNSLSSIRIMHQGDHYF